MVNDKTHEQLHFPSVGYTGTRSDMLNLGICLQWECGCLKGDIHQHSIVRHIHIFFTYFWLSRHKNAQYLFSAEKTSFFLYLMWSVRTNHLYEVSYVHTLSKNQQTEQLQDYFHEENITKFYFWGQKSGNLTEDLWNMSAHDQIQYLSVGYKTRHMINYSIP